MGRGLTSSEERVLALIGQGKKSKEIAKELGITAGTVANYRKVLARKLNLHSTGGLAARGAMTVLGGAFGTDCTITIVLPSAGEEVEITYAGKLQASGGAARVTIGSTVFRF